MIGTITFPVTSDKAIDDSVDDETLSLDQRFHLDVFEDTAGLS
jgi:hypothetical protein